MESNPSGVMMKAGCGTDCEAPVTTLIPKSKSKVTLSNNTNIPLTTIPEKISTSTIYYRELVATTPGELLETTEFSHDPRRERRNAELFGTKECCYNNHCNHGSPCGELTCSAGIPASTTLIVFPLIVLMEDGQRVVI